MKEDILKLYEYLPEPYKTEAIANYDYDYALRVAPSMLLDDSLATKVSQAVCHGFNWSISPQRQSYWACLCEDLYSKKVELILEPPFYTKFLIS